MLAIDLRKKTAFVTAGSRGIGAAICRTLGAAGANVAVTYVTSKSAAEKTADIIRAAGSEAIVVKCDVTDSVGVDAAVAETTKRLGPIDILVANAGVGTAKPITETSDDEYHRVFDLNVRGFVAAARAALPAMKEKRAGRVVIISSVTGRSGKAFRSSSPTYAGSKGALIGYAKGLAREGAPFNITVNCICPGWIDWKDEQGDKHGATAPEVRAQALREIALGRTGTADDVAGAVAFLASDLAAYITGATIDVNGGLYMG